MMHITLCCVGKIRESYLQEGIREFEKRLSGYCQLQIFEVQDEKTPENASAAEEERIRKKEANRLHQKLPAEAKYIVLDQRGRRQDSPAMAAQLAQWAMQGTSHIVFIIGGSLGLDPSILQRADEVWSFSEFTFPHPLMRLILLEQIYRSFRINRGEPYHK